MKFVAFGSLWTLQYALNGVLQCLSASNLWQRISFHGLHFLETPVFIGKAFNHIVKSCTKLIMSCYGWYKKVSMARILLQHFFTTLIFLFISSTIYFIALMFTLTCGERSLIFSKYMFTSAVCTLKPSCEYSCNTLVRLIANYFPVIFSIHSAIISPTPLLNVTLNGFD